MLALAPLSQTVAPGSEFDVVLTVANACPAFNAFHLIVAYDTTALTAVKLSPLSSQMGALVTAACGNNVNWFHMGAGVDTVDVSLLCPETSISGPGAVYRIHFRASATPQVTTLRVLPDAQFANAGILLADVTLTGAAIGIGTAPTLDAGAPPPALLVLAAAPNPASGGVRLDFGRPLSADGTLSVHDVQGRLVRTIPVARGARSGAWDGREGSGRAAAPGQYVVALHAGGLLRTVRVTHLR